MARLTARRTAGLSKGGRLWLITTLSLPFWPTSVMTRDGALFFAASAIALVISSGTKASRRPAWRAARRVPRSVMTV